MTPDSLTALLQQHRAWLMDPATGAHANLSDADLRNANLGNADLRNADLRGAKLGNADLSGANLRDAKLGNADLRGANLRDAKLGHADLRGANLRDAKLGHADLRGANLSDAKLGHADLRGANLRGAKLGNADLSGVRGLCSPTAFLETLETHVLGLICYKRLGSTHYPPPEHWLPLQPGHVLTEVVNPDRCTDCGSGVNVGTLAWCRAHYPDGTLWKCLLRWQNLAGVVVPYHTDGKFRAERVELLEVVSDATA